MTKIRFANCFKNQIVKPDHKAILRDEPVFEYNFYPIYNSVQEVNYSGCTSTAAPTPAPAPTPSCVSGGGICIQTANGQSVTTGDCCTGYMCMPNPTDLNGYCIAQ